MYPYSMNLRTRRNIKAQLNKKPLIGTPSANDGNLDPDSGMSGNNNSNNTSDNNLNNNNDYNNGNNGSYNNGYNNGCNNGTANNNGYTNGYNNGTTNNGYTNGANNGTANNNGYTNGYNNGTANNNGYANGYNNGTANNGYTNGANNGTANNSDNTTASRPVVNRYILEMLKSALSDEAADADYYERLAKLVECPQDNELINKIKNDEIKHYNILSNIYYELTGSRPEDAEYEVIEIKPDISENFASSIISELESAAFYNKLLVSFLNIELRDWFNEIMTDEQAHAQIMNYLFSKYTK